MVECEGESG